MTAPTPDNLDFSPEQKHYLEGFAAGSGLARTLVSLPTFSATLGLPADKPRSDESPAGPDFLQRIAQDRLLADGAKLSAEEMAKRASNPLDMWDHIQSHATQGRFPKGTDVFLFKYQGMFYVAPAQDSFMCRLRIPAGILSSHQLRGIAQLAENFGGAYADVTTRANLQIRQIAPRHTIDLLEGLADLGIITRGAGADNVRNITASPTAGIDPQELIDTRPLASRMHHHILNRRELFGLPRKFNIAFDGGGTISCLQDTNDIGFVAVRASDGRGIVQPGLYFRMYLGGITGHGDFARDTGLLLFPDQCVAVASAALRVYIAHGDRTDRKKARLKYLLDKWGFERFLDQTQAALGKPLLRFPLDACDPRPSISRGAHVGFHPQKQEGLHYVGVVLPVGRMTSAQMRGLALIADQYGSGTLRLTVWQNLLISDIPSRDIPLVKREIESLGLAWNATSIRAGLVACTGSAGCKFAAADTKRHALAIADHLDRRLNLDTPVNIHLTGCHHSCAQHFIGDIGLLATKVPVADDMVEGFHLYVGGGYGDQQEIGRELLRDLLAQDIPPLLERFLRAYLDRRAAPDEPLAAFLRRHSINDLRAMAQHTPVTAEP